MASKFKNWVAEVKAEWVATYEEFKEELIPKNVSKDGFKTAFAEGIVYFTENWIHIPYFPAFHRPGWLLRYIVGPFDGKWVEGIFADFWAGITVALTLIPQVIYLLLFSLLFYSLPVFTLRDFRTQPLQTFL